MDELITAGIDAKHSNENNIAPFEYWTKEYGGKIGNFGGVDMNVLCTFDEKEISEYVGDLLSRLGSYRSAARNDPDSIRKTHGLAFGSGNQITDYTPPENSLAMVRAFKK